MDLITIVITTHKRNPEIVERALVSVLNQTYPQTEVIVVDDSPSDYIYRDDVMKMIKKYNKVKYIRHSSCMGACVARNTGLSEANGKYIGYLDDDDEWKANKLELQIAGFTDDNVALVYCGSETKNDQTGMCVVSDTKFIKGNVYEQLILKNFIGSTSFPLIRTDYLKSIGGFDPLMKSAQDYDVWLRLSMKYTINYVEVPLVIYHIHDGCRISNVANNKVKGLERLNEKNMAYLNSHKTARWQRTIKLAPMYANNGQTSKALNTWINCVCLCPIKLLGNFKYLYRVIIGIEHRRKLKNK